MTVKLAVDVLDLVAVVLRHGGIPSGLPDQPG
jgi:hypothetical protein